METQSFEIVDAETFTDYEQVFRHIHQTLSEKGVVKPSYFEALKAREAEYPTGIELDGYAVAIPHCDVEHANRPFIYILRLPQPIKVQQADGDELLDVQLVINLVVTDPLEQLRLLKTLFSQLQDNNFYQALLTLPIAEAKAVFQSTINP
ncbi:PTS galactitol transporter subunit IIA [Glaesserella sp.]|uniref:PTS galactitol transporter subunit IIA n=1 Tax=Glaesserella sp. TaxID=2094731 RepID=UPI0035A02380